MQAKHLNFSHPSFRGWIGVARQDITPPVGIYARNWGAAQHDVAEGIHRPLEAAVMTIQEEPGAAPLVLATVDLGWWQDLDDERHVRGGVLENMNLDPGRLMLCASHTHAGPSLVRSHRDLPGGHLIGPYLDQLRDTLTQITQRALDGATPAMATWNYGRCGLAQDRDLADPNAQRFLCGYHPEGQPDDTILVGCVTSEAGTPLATLVNYACHPTTLAAENRLISPDFVGSMREVVEARYPGPCLFLQGASAELSPRECHHASTEIADKNGRELGFAVLSTLEGMLPAGKSLQFDGVVESGAPLAIWKRCERAVSTSIEVQQLDVELELKELPSLAQIETDLKSCQDRALAERLLREQLIRRHLGDGLTSRQPVWIWRVGEAIFVGQPNEAYSIFQQQLRTSCPDQAVAVIGQVNGSCGYLPPAEFYDQDMYPVWQTPFARGSLERITAACQASITK